MNTEKIGFFPLPNVGGFPGIELGFPPCWRAYFFLLRQEKVAKKKATPGCAVGYANSPALLEGPGDSLNSPAAQTTRVEGPRPFSVARRSTWGPERRDASSSGEIIRRLRSRQKIEGGAASHTPPNPRHRSTSRTYSATQTNQSTNQSQVTNSE